MKNYISHKSHVITKTDSSVLSEIKKKKQASPLKSNINSKNQYFRLGNGLNGELLPISGVTSMNDHSASFYVTPNLAYESLLAKPGIQNL